MVDPNYEILWDENPGAGLGNRPTENYGTWLDDPVTQEITD